LFARGILNADHFAAAQRYRQLRGALYGVALARPDPGKPQADPAAIARVQRQFDAMARRLRPAQKTAVTDLALDLRPRWLRQAVLGLELDQADRHERQDLLEGLDRLGA
jgi:hypothetical protein